jgi:hypothetical protein
VKLLLTVLAVVAVWPGVTQAEGRVEAAERKMTAADAALVGRLDGPAKAHFEADQARWLGDRRTCDVNPPRKAECLESRYRERTQVLAAVAKAPYPFISQQTIVQSGNGQNGRYAVDIAYPRFDGHSADFAAINRRFAAAAQTRLPTPRQPARIARSPRPFCSIGRPPRSSR